MANSFREGQVIEAGKNLAVIVQEYLEYKGVPLSEDKRNYVDGEFRALIKASVNFNRCYLALAERE